MVATASSASGHLSANRHIPEAADLPRNVSPDVLAVPGDPHQLGIEMVFELAWTNGGFCANPLKPDGKFKRRATGGTM